MINEIRLDTRIRIFELIFFILGFICAGRDLEEWEDSEKRPKIFQNLSIK